MNEIAKFDIRMRSEANEVRKEVLSRFPAEQFKVESSTTRDFHTIITVAGALAATSKAILELYNFLQKPNPMHEVELEDAAGNILKLRTANAEQIKTFLRIASESFNDGS